MNIPPSNIACEYFQQCALHQHTMSILAMKFCTNTVDGQLDLLEKVTNQLCNDSHGLQGVTDLSSSTGTSNGHESTGFTGSTGMTKDLESASCLGSGSESHSSEIDVDPGPEVTATKRR